MDFINVYDNLISKDICGKIIKDYAKDYSDKSIKRSANLESSVSEVNLSNIPYWKDLTNSLVSLIAPKIKDYLSFSTVTDPNFYYFEHVALMHHKELTNIPYHYDIEIASTSKMVIRNFAALIYLNNDFEGGELFFPIQKKVIKPEPGKLVIFPTFFTHPHVTSPAIGGDRYVLRFNYFFNVASSNIPDIY